MIARMKFDIGVLVNEMLDRLPKSVWTDGTTTFFDPSIGGGQFVREVERRLFAAGASLESVRARVSGFAEDRLSLNFATKALVGKYRIGHVEDLESMSKQFDVIVGNPPYQDGEGKSSTKLWKQFIDTAIGHVCPNGYVAMVTPPSWLSPGSIYDTMMQYDMEWVNLNVAHHFNVGSMFSAWVLCKRPAKGTSVFVTEAGTNTVVWKDMPMLPSTITPVSISITRKLLGGPTFNFLACNDNDTRREHMSPERTSECRWEVMHTNAQTWWSSVRPENYDTPKVIITRSGYAIPVYSDACGTSQIAYYLVVKNAVEGKRVVKLLSRKLYQVLMNRLWKYSGWNQLNVIQRLPAVDRSIDWTDEALYAHFGLTKAEIAYIEANAK